MATTEGQDTQAQYKFLSPNFLRGSARGQINSVYRTRNEQPEKVAEYRQAVVNGDVSLGDEITKQQAAKLIAMNVPIPSTTKVKQSRGATEGGEASAKAA